jgi:VanZ family protein
MPRLPRHPNFWLASFLLWFGVLWGLSSFRIPSEGLPLIPNFDKIVHFGYFFGGSGLISAWLYRRSPENPNWWKIIGTAVLIVAIVGGIDEFHQSFTRVSPPAAAEMTSRTGSPMCWEPPQGRSPSSGFIIC